MRSINLRFLLCFITLLLPIKGADALGSADTSGSSPELALLKQILADQQRQITELRAALEAQQQVLNSMAANPSSPAGIQVASLAPVIPASPAVTASAALSLPRAQGPAAAGSPPQVAAVKTDPPSPLQLRIGDAFITPVGFMDFTAVTRSTTTGTSLGTNFGSIPFEHTQQAGLSETRLTTQNSRVGFRVDTAVKGARVLGYLESDFLGFVPANAAVTSNSDSLRMRLYFADVQKGKLEFLGGQSWSMLTPSRRGIGALPGDLFFSQVIDTNYVNGLTWSRQSGFRVVYHSSPKLAFGVALENAEQYVGGSGGGGRPTFPIGVSSLIGSEFNDGTTTLAAPSLHPDLIAKMAWDPNPKFHLEIAGLERTFKDYVLSTETSHTTIAGGGQFNIAYEVAPGLRLFTNNFISDGGGRYLFGVAPDLIVRGDGSISAIRAHSTLDGLEFTHKNTQAYVYYGGVFIGRNTAVDPATGREVGYGFTGSNNASNRAINEATFGLNQTFWRDPRYGAMNLMFQYAYLQRNPWFVASGTPSEAHAHMFWLNLRYTLPGSAPTLGR